jgi:exopolyphosphatase/guanosine-5'-triphosphate,3'-diphosphate pyrophosphatase
VTEMTSAPVTDRRGGDVRPRGRFGHISGAIDLGTNNCRLLIAKPTTDGFRVIDAFSRIVRLGEGLSTAGELSEAAIRRSIAALRVCADKIARRGVTRLRCVATEACRKASNGASTGYTRRPG